MVRIRQLKHLGMDDFSFGQMLTTHVLFSSQGHNLMCVALIKCLEFSHLITKNC